MVDSELFIRNSFECENLLEADLGPCKGFV